MDPFKRSLRTQQEINQRIRHIQHAWKEICEKTPDIQDDMHDVFFGELEGLYWVLGYSREMAADYASIDLGGDFIDRS